MTIACVASVSGISFPVLLLIKLSFRNAKQLFLIFSSFTQCLVGEMENQKRSIGQYKRIRKSKRLISIVSILVFGNEGIWSIDVHILKGVVFGIFLAITNGGIKPTLYSLLPLSLSQTQGPNLMNVRFDFQTSCVPTY